MSKSWRVLLLAAALFSSLYAEGVQWRSWDAGMQEAKTTGKIIMIDAVRTDCHYCKDMDEAVFKDSAMAAYIEKRFIPVKVNLSNEKMPLNLNVEMTPTFFFVTKEGDLLKKVPGSWNQEDFRSFLDGVKQ
ncbi:MAG: DUF255 domain-containing protein [Sulfurimonadaceae bacterium]